MRPRILFIFLSPTAFVRDDLQLLGAHYDVRAFHFDANRYRSAPGRLFGLFYFFLAQAVWLLRELPRAQGVYGWFADYHMALPVLLARWMRKPAAVVIGGFDGNTLPELGYGVFLSRWRGPLARFVVQGASLLLPNTAPLMFAESRYPTWPEVRRNGLLAHVPDLRTPYEVIPVGFDPAGWPFAPGERPPVVLCVAYVRTAREVLVKGIDVLLQAAARVPEATFRVVGVTPAQAAALRAQYSVPANVELVPPCPREDLPGVYALASVYVQLSRLEGGLPNVVCEAMLCGCVPVVSEVGNMPQTVGEAGYVVEAPDPDRIAEVVRTALRADEAQRRRARAQIIEHFTLERRRRALLDRLNRLYATPAA